MSEPYEASVTISKGVRPIANSGWVTIADGHLRLFDSKGALVAEAPTAHVAAKGKHGTMGSAVAIWIGDDKYMLGAGPGSRPLGNVYGTAASVGSTTVWNGRKFAKSFYAALEAAGGRHGKPA